MSKELPMDYLNKIQTSSELFQIGDYWIIDGIKYRIINKVNKVNKINKEEKNSLIKAQKSKKKVNQEDFYNFINNYNSLLTRDYYGACDPPLITYNDFSLGDWPNSIVAFTYLYDNDPEGYYYIPEDKKEYYIYK